MWKTNVNQTNKLRSLESLTLYAQVKLPSRLVRQLAVEFFIHAPLLLSHRFSTRVTVSPNRKKKKKTAQKVLSRWYFSVTQFSSTFKVLLHTDNAINLILHALLSIQNRHDYCGVCQTIKTATKKEFRIIICKQTFLWHINWVLKRDLTNHATNMWKWFDQTTVWFCDPLHKKWRTHKYIWFTLTWLRETAKRSDLSFRSIVPIIMHWFNQDLPRKNFPLNWTSIVAQNNCVPKDIAHCSKLEFILFGPA